MASSVFYLMVLAPLRTCLYVAYQSCKMAAATVSPAGLRPFRHRAWVVRVSSPCHFSGCFGAQGCNLDWRRTAYNQPQKLFWTAKNDRWGAPDCWSGRGNARALRALLMAADDDICAADRAVGECRATKSLHSLLFKLSPPEGSDLGALISTSLSQTTGCLLIKSQWAANSPDT